MAEISRKLIDELKTIIKEEYGKELTNQEASEMARDLVGYFDLLAKIYHREAGNGKK
jgi:hypothetical protein